MKDIILTAKGAEAISFNIADLAAHFNQLTDEVVQKMDTKLRGILSAFEINRANITQG